MRLSKSQSIILHMSKEDRFDLEDKISKMLNIIDDLEVLIKKMYDMPEKPSEDQVLNTLFGIMELHKQRHEQLWAQFEDMIKEERIT